MSKSPLTHVSLFSGIGGIDLAAHWAGFETVAFVERDAYCQKVLAKNFPGVPIYDDVRTFPATQFRGVDLVSGGFPCQPYSQAGKRLGADDDRALWPAMLGVVEVIEPAWVVGENVAGFVGMGLDGCLSDLEAKGYEAGAYLLPACGVGAPHQRYRIFIVANARSGGCDARPVLRPCQGQRDAQPGHRSETLADAPRDLQSRQAPIGAERERAWERGEPSGQRHWKLEPSVGRVVDGAAHRVERLRALGNAVVPQQCYPILQAIADSLAVAA